jgi:DNA-binding XRE family transcriptional regulator
MSDDRLPFVRLLNAEPSYASFRKGKEEHDPFGIIMHDPFWIKGALLITVEQIRAARGLLGWSQTKLAERAGLSLPTVKRVEAQRGPKVSTEAREKLRRALESGGVEFIREDGGGPGVRLRKRRDKRSK